MREVAEDRDPPVARDASSLLVLGLAISKMIMVLQSNVSCYNPLMARVINIDPNVLGGTPVFAGSRVPIESLFDYLKRGRSIGYFLQQFPTVKRKQIEELLDDAQAKTLSHCAPI